jgi:hypothetical protein
VTVVTGLLLACSSLSTEFSADGYVYDKTSKLPIEAASVTLTTLNKESNVLTDEKGYFKLYLDIFPDSTEAAVLIIHKDGYKNYSKVIHWMLDLSSTAYYLEPQ